MNYEQSNIGLGMVPHKKSCRCNECEIERLTTEVSTLKADHKQNELTWWDEKGALDDRISELTAEGERKQAQLHTIRKLAIDWIQGVGEPRHGTVLNAIFQHAYGKAEPDTVSGIQPHSQEIPEGVKATLHDALRDSVTVVDARSYEAILEDRVKILEATLDCGNTCADSRLWTSRKPKEPGYHWWKQGDRIEPCEIRRVGDTLEAWFIGEADPIIDWQWQPDWKWKPAATEQGESDD